MKAPNHQGIQWIKYPYYFEAFVEQHNWDLREIRDHPIVLYYSFFHAYDQNTSSLFRYEQSTPPVLHIKQKNLKAVAKDLDDEAQMHKMVEVSLSFAKFGAKGNAVKWEFSLSPSQRTKGFLCSCIVEKLTQVPGLPHNSAQTSPLIFNDKTTSSSL